MAGMCIRESFITALHKVTAKTQCKASRSWTDAPNKIIIIMTRARYGEPKPFQNSASFTSAAVLCSLRAALKPIPDPGA
jgi:hypothetical protein